jgi:exosortase
MLPWGIRRGGDKPGNVAQLTVAGPQVPSGFQPGGHRYRIVKSESAASAMPLLIATSLLAIFLCLNLQVVSDWATYSFDDGTYSHAFLIPLMSGFLLYRGWKQGALQLRWSWQFCLLLALGLLCYQWLEFAHQRYFARAMVPLCMILTLLAVFRASRFVVGAAALFWFVTPIWGPASEALQWASVRAVSAIMSYTGIPTFVYGEFVQIPAGTFEIADGCSGLRYVIAMLALVFFYSVLYLRRLRSVILLFTGSLLAAMLTNWLRIVALIFIGHFSDMQSSLIRDHNMFGWFLFFPLLIAVFYVADRLEPAGESPGTNARAAANFRGNEGAGANTAFAVLPAVLCLVLISGAALRVSTGQSPFAIDAQLNVDTAVPISIAGMEELSPVVFAAQEVEVSPLPNGGRLVDISFSGAIDAQRAEFYLNDPVPEGWRVVSSVEEGAVTRLLVANGRKNAVIYLSYGVGSRWYAGRDSLRWPRLQAALSLDRGSMLRWAFVPCEAECNDAAQKAAAAING